MGFFAKLFGGGNADDQGASQEPEMQQDMGQEAAPAAPEAEMQPEAPEAAAPVEEENREETPAQ